MWRALPRWLLTQSATSRRTTVTAVKIEGVLHEFSTVPGVLEDVSEIILNLKRVRFSFDAEGPVRGHFEKRGKGTSVSIELDGKTKTLVPEFTIKGPMQEQIDQMVTALKQRIKSYIGITAEISVQPPGTVPRSEGKARRVIDKRRRAGRRVDPEPLEAGKHKVAEIVIGQLADETGAEQSVLGGEQGGADFHHDPFGFFQ